MKTIIICIKLIHFLFSVNGVGWKPKCGKILEFLLPTFKFETYWIFRFRNEQSHNYGYLNYVIQYVILIA